MAKSISRTNIHKGSLCIYIYILSTVVCTPFIYRFHSEISTAQTNTYNTAHTVNKTHLYTVHTILYAYRQTYIGIYNLKYVCIQMTAIHLLRMKKKIHSNKILFDAQTIFDTIYSTYYTTKYTYAYGTCIIDMIGGRTFGLLYVFCILSKFFSASVFYWLCIVCALLTLRSSYSLFFFALCFCYLIPNQ